MLLGEAPPAGYMLTMFREVAATVRAPEPSALAVAKATPKRSAAICGALLRSPAAPDFESRNSFAALGEDKWPVVGAEPSPCLSQTCASRRARGLWHHHGNLDAAGPRLRQDAPSLANSEVQRPLLMTPPLR